MEEKRIFRVEPYEFSESDVAQIPYAHDGKHLELFYNLIFNEVDIKLPDHLRPVAWAMADQNIRYLMVIISPGSGKSYLSGIAFPLWEIGQDQNLTIMGVSAGADLMIGWLRNSMNIIENNKVYKLLFPNVGPDKGQGWAAGSGAFVKRTITGEPTPTYFATGVGSKSITGQHAKLLVLDDLHDAENSANSDQIAKVETFYYNTLVGRQHPKGSRFVMIGRRWASDDLYGRLKKTGEWLTMTLANFRETEQLYYDVRIPPNLPCVFNNYKPSPEVEDIKVVYGENDLPGQVGFFWKGMNGPLDQAVLQKKNFPSVFETVYQSNPEEAGTQIFREQDFQDFYIPPQAYMGRSQFDTAEFMGRMDFDLVIQSWDTAATDDTANDPSCGLTMGLKGCTKNHRIVDEENPPEVPYHFDIYVLDENYQWMNTADLEREVVEYFYKWNPNYVIVEKSITGLPIIGRLESYSVQVVGIVVQHTSKKSRAISGAKTGSTQGWAREGRVWIPRNAMWSQAFIGELVDFTGARNKKDDRVDALVQATNWAIDLGITNRELPPGWRERSDIDARTLSLPKTDPFSKITSAYNSVANPYYGRCGTCQLFKKEESFCTQHKIKVPKIGTCDLYDPEKDIEAIVSVRDGEIKR